MPPRSSTPAARSSAARSDRSAAPGANGAGLAGAGAGAGGSWTRGRGGLGPRAAQRRRARSAWRDRASPPRCSRDRRTNRLAWPHVAALDLDAGRHLHLRARRRDHRDRQARLSDVRVDRGGHRRVRHGARGRAPGGRAGGPRPGAPRRRLRLRAGAQGAPCARRARTRRPTPQWAVNQREDVDATLREAATAAPRPGSTSHVRAPGRPADAILDVAEEQQRRPDRGRQQGHDRGEALPAGLGAEQGLPPRALQRAHHPDGLARRAPSSLPRFARAGVDQPGAVHTSPPRCAEVARGAPQRRGIAVGLGLAPSTPLASTSAATADTCGAAIEVPLARAAGLHAEVAVCPRREGHLVACRGPATPPCCSPQVAERRRRGRRRARRGRARRRVEYAAEAAVLGRSADGDDVVGSAPGRRRRRSARCPPRRPRPPPCWCGVAQRVADRRDSLRGVDLGRISSSG